MECKCEKVKKFSSNELAYFCEQVAMLLHGGVSANDGIYILCQEMDDTPYKKTLMRIDEYLKAGISFHQALQNTGTFPDYVVQMVRVGETTGKLEDVMMSLSGYYDRENRLKTDLRSAITYPFLLYLMMSVILYIFVFKILPIFKSMYEELNSEVSFSSDHLMNFGVNLGMMSAVIFGLFALLFAVLFLLCRTRKGRSSMKKLGYHLILTRKITDLMSTGRFISSMALMISTGLETKKALELASSTNDSSKFQCKVIECTRCVESGMSLENALCKSKLLNGIEARMIKVSARSGTSDIILKKLGDKYDEKISVFLGKVSTYLETFLVILLVVLLGIILLSLMLPLINIISSMG